MKVMSIMYSFILILSLTGITVSSCTTSTYTEKKSTSTEPPIGTSPDTVKKSTSTKPFKKTFPWEPNRGERAKFTYRYFPSSSVYFNIDRGKYFYLSEGKWVDSYSLPQAIPIDRDNHVILKMTIDKPYMFHKDVKKKYPPRRQR